VSSKISAKEENGRQNIQRAQQGDRKFTLLSFNEGVCSPANANLLLEVEKPKSVPTLKRPKE
jgi:hypothetical protein